MNRGRGLAVGLFDLIDRRTTDQQEREQYDMGIMKAAGRTRLLICSLCLDEQPRPGQASCEYLQQLSLSAQVQDEMKTNVCRIKS